MREIKFRAWHKDEKLMCNIDVLNINDGAFLIGVKPEEDYLVDGGKTWVIAPENGRYCGIDEIELMQFTGLKDSSGVDIYEGDICKFHIFTQELGENLGVYEGEKETTVEISISEFGIWLQGDSEENSGYALWFDGIHEESFEVIGNIHENKDLLT